MLLTKHYCWFIFLCFLSFAITIQAQEATGNAVNSNTTQEEKTSEHSLIANYPTYTEKTTTYQYGENSDAYLYESSILSNQQLTETNKSTVAEPTYYYENSNYNLAPTSTEKKPTIEQENATASNSDSGSFVDVILDIQHTNTASTTPQTRVVPVATVEDIHTINGRQNRFEEYDRNGTLTNQTENIPNTRVVPVATVEDIHTINGRQDRFEEYDRNGTLTNQTENIPNTRVVPVATVEDIHTINGRQDRFEEYDRNGTLTNQTENIPNTRVVPVATVEDINEIKQSDAYQPYQNHAPVVQPSSVKKESPKQRKERYSDAPTYENADYTPINEDGNTPYTVEAKPKHQKRSFKEFIQETFTPPTSEDTNYEGGDSNSNTDQSRPSRSSKSSKEYKSRPVKGEKETGSTKTENKQEDSKATRSTRD
ncbi:MAG: hypothetical protein R3E32_29305 [Chitinophagales bacterium]